MTHQRGPGDGLDVPLVWEQQPTQPASGQKPARPRHGVLRLRARALLASLVDLGCVLVAIGCTIGSAALAGASLHPAQLVIAGALGLLLAALVAVGALWAWRATPGMLLLELCFSAAMPLGNAVRLWPVWLLGSLLLGVPLVLGRRGRSVGERLAGAELSSRSPRASV